MENQVTFTNLINTKACANEDLFLSKGDLLLKQHQEQLEVKFKKMSKSIGKWKKRYEEATLRSQSLEQQVQLWKAAHDVEKSRRAAVEQELQAIVTKYTALLFQHDMMNPGVAPATTSTKNEPVSIKDVLSLSLGADHAQSNCSVVVHQSLGSPAVSTGDSIMDSFVVVGPSDEALLRWCNANLVKSSGAENHPATAAKPSRGSVKAKGRATAPVFPKWSRRKIFKSKQKVVSLSISLEDLEELHVDMEPEPTMTPEVLLSEAGTGWFGASILPGLADFCFPKGLQPRIITSSSVTDSMTEVNSILFGSGQTQRNGNSFVFMVQCELSGSMEVVPLYGSCLLLSSVVRVYKQLDGSISFLQDLHLSDSNLPSPPIHIEVPRAYCIFSRYPLFPLHFQFLWDIVAAERLRIINEMISDGVVVDNAIHSSGALNMSFLHEAAQRFAALQVPKCQQHLTFQLRPDLDALEYHHPQGGCQQISEDWNLPVLFSTVPLPTLLMTLGCLLCEMQVAVVSEDLCVVSACTLGLASLLSPMRWVNTLLPVLPFKYTTLLDAPVPFLVGLPQLPKDASSNIIVLDLSTGQLRVHQSESSEDQSHINNEEEVGSYKALEPLSPDLVLPGHQGLLNAMTPALLQLHEAEERTPRKSGSTPSYHYAPNQRSATRDLQRLVKKHMEDLYQCAALAGAAAAKAKSGPRSANDTHAWDEEEQHDPDLQFLQRLRNTQCFTVYAASSTNMNTSE